MRGKEEECNNLIEPLFETKAGKGRAAHRFYCFTVAVGIVSVWAYRLSHGGAAWLWMFSAEVLFGLYWILTQAARWRVVHRHPFPERLKRYKDKLPRVDIFVCTADHTLEPPLMVINTVLSLMSYNYPPERLAVYLSDDGCSKLTFYTLLEASKFSQHWIPFCKKHNVQPRAPEIYFARSVHISQSKVDFMQEWTQIKKLYDDMKSRIESASKDGCIGKDNLHKGFSEWNSGISKQDHPSIVEILIEGWNPQVTDVEGNKLPALVYLSREKRPGWGHNFKAGAMNSLIRVSEAITNAPIILNLDCDMYSNDPNAIHDVLCFFLDEKQGGQISYVQYPQRFNNLTENDIYANAARATFQIELAGIDGFGGALYIGTGCFHKRVSLMGQSYSKDHCMIDAIANDCTITKTIKEMEEASKPLINCSYEKGTLWGKEMGLVYGCPVEDIVTGLTIQCRGWKPVYYNPEKNAFEGLGVTTFDTELVQFKRWSEGMFQIFCSKYCPFTYGRGKIPLGAQMGYCVYLLWAPMSFPMLCYVIVPALCLFRGVPLFPKASSLWFFPFAYVYIARTIYSLVEGVHCGDTIKAWWNLQRMTFMRRIGAFLFAFFDTVTRQLGLSETTFALTDKVMDEELQKRFKNEVLEFGGSSSITFVIIATVAVLNLLSFVYGIQRVVVSAPDLLTMLLPQVVISGIIVLVNLPVYEALFLRKDKGGLPSIVLFKSLLVVVLMLYLIPIY